MKAAFIVIVLLAAWSGCSDAWFGGGGGNSGGGGGNSGGGGGNSDSGGGNSGGGGGNSGGGGGNSGGGGGNSGGSGNKGEDKGTKGTAGVEASKEGGVSVSGGVSHKGDGWSGGVKGKVDNKGNWEASAGVTIELGKRSIDWNGLHYTVRVRSDPCDFQVYDVNKDGVIVKNEMLAIFDDHAKAEELLKALDITTDDGRIEEEEFDFMSRVVIDGCDLMDRQ